jgi:acyl-CoA thioester hydrolase
VPISEFRYPRRVQFAETDMVGVVHFANFLRYMEEAEHALWREAGLSIVPAGSDIGFPRVAASIDYHAPLYFEDEFVVHIRVDAISKRSIRYRSVIMRGSTTIASGTVTAACVRRVPPPMKAVDIPEDIASRFAVADA